MPASAPLQAPRFHDADVVLAASEAVEPSLPLGSDGVRRWVWESRYGPILIEVVGNEVFVNGQRVELHAP